MGDKVSVNIELPADLHTQLKIRAASKRVTLKAAVLKAIQDWVKNAA